MLIAGTAKQHYSNDCIYSKYSVYRYYKLHKATFVHAFSMRRYERFAREVYVHAHYCFH
jgi:hypothetical protein